MKKCNHYPIVYMEADVKHGGCWKVIERDMNHIVRQCMKCGAIDAAQLTSYSPELFITEKRRIALKKERNDNVKNMIQPIDQKTGKFNEEFGRAYGYNPMKTPAPQMNKPDDDLDKQMANDNVNERKVKMNKL